MIIGRVWSWATVPATANDQAPTPFVPGVRISTPVSGSDGWAPAGSLADVLIAAKTRPWGSPASCLRLMWSSAKLGMVLLTSSLRQALSGSPSSWMAKWKPPDCWSEYRTPTLEPNPISAEMSSVWMVVSATLGLNGATHEDPVASVECVTHTVDARVQVTQNFPVESWSIVADSEPPLGI